MARSVFLRERKAGTVQWTVRINGIDHVSVKPGERVEIGRKPLRPLADDGNTRVDVIDGTKSMSKRHAVFEVQQSGGAVICDLNSTNGTYVVRDNGDLLRLPAGVDFLLPTSPMRMQFGDVPVDLIRLEQPVEAEPEDTPVPDLFGFAVEPAKQEPDAADMSVDDILDLRAGEPTSMFDAASVKRRVSELDLSNPLTQLDREPEQPRDLFADAVATTAGESQTQAAPQLVPLAADEVAMQPASVDPFATVAAVAETPTDAAPVDADKPEAMPEAQTEASADALSFAASGSFEAAEAAQSAEQSVFVAQSVFAAQSEPVDQPAASDRIAPVDETASDSYAAVEPEAQGEGDTPMAQTTEPQVIESQTAEPQRIVFAPMEDASPTPTTTVASAATPTATAANASMTFTAMESGNDMAADAYTPAFEPGSVFERVSKGEFDAQEQVVQVDGLNSDDARRTEDFAMQFEMARHPELLPFLAMNPSLYDDLYAWLAAQGNRDIDEALARNQGYQDYREAVGK
ncbi:FHA domain-containing protein [Bifidobacterium eulemuris]|uniref:FHA domain-containing protein n=1 Tax=Bifidobacterium eulemuris TaxID=1765219 RepID=A0A261G3D0_9BIFI|nr:FHA domain-containing protein [Bifidobacterium eulemuris]OZG65920.1 hypothetical protein BEUL_1818 [Bifidobacterium eulemuris]QOL31988.1 FHA domain-containing protein [Bifidobacterium eulemuris]